MNNITESDIKFLKVAGLDTDKKSIETFSFIKNNFLTNPSNTSKDERALYSFLVLEGFNNPKSKNYSELGKKLCSTFNDNTSGKKAENLKSRLLVLGYLSSSKNKLMSIINKERIKNLKAIKEKLEKQQGNFISLIKNENISPKYKKIIIERALKYNLAQPQKETVINMASDRAPVYANKLINNYSRGRR